MSTHMPDRLHDLRSYFLSLDIKSKLGKFAAAMLQQPRVPTTGQRQAIEIQIKWREVLAQKQAFLRILSKHTGHSMQKLDAVSALSLPTLRVHLIVLWQG